MLYITPRAVRFEDLALNYTRETRRLFQTLGRPMGTGVEDYLKAHTNTSRDKNAYSTYRVSHDVPFQWTNELDYRFVSEIQVSGSGKTENIQPFSDVLSYRGKKLNIPT